MIQRFLWLAMGYWKGQTQRPAWVLSVGFLICLVVNTYMALAVNRWSKSFFDALQTHKVDEVTGGILQLAILAVGVGLASIATTQFRMRLQVNWRLWLTASLIEKWLVNESRQACAISPAIDNPEARIADDGRLAIELFVDLAGGVINIFLVSAAFILVLWQVGGSYEFFGVVIPGYLVLAVFVYSVVTSFCMWVLGRPLVASVEAKAAAEGNFRYALTRARHEFEVQSGGGSRRGHRSRYWRLPAPSRRQGGSDHSGSAARDRRPEREIPSTDFSFCSQRPGGASSRGRQRSSF